MPSKSRQEIGWLSPFLALLTIGLQKPDTINSNQAPGTPAVEALATDEIVLLEAAKRQKSLNFERGREFQLSARLSVTAQMNRPKHVEVKRRKINGVSASAQPWKQTIKPFAQRARSNDDTANVIRFPTQANFDRQLPEAA